MGVDDAEGAGLALQVLDDARQHRMLEHVGEVSGVEGVAVIHRGSPSRGLRKSVSAALPGPRSAHAPVSTRRARPAVGNFRFTLSIASGALPGEARRLTRSSKPGLWPMTSSVSTPAGVERTASRMRSAGAS